MQFPAYTLTIPNPAEKIKGDEVMYPNTNTHGIFGTLSMQARTIGAAVPSSPNAAMSITSDKEPYL